MPIDSAPRGTFIRHGEPGDLESILAIVAAWPTHFIPDALELVRADATDHYVLVHATSAGIQGFLIYQMNSCEIELLWLAIDPSVTRHGIGSALVAAALGMVTTQLNALAKTASLDSAIPGTLFSGHLFGVTCAFFEKNGFRQIARLDKYWGPENHCLIFSRPLFS